MLQYDALDRVTQTRLPNGEVVTTTYNAAGQAVGLQAGNQTLIASATYNALRQPSIINNGNTLKAHYLYYGLDMPNWASGHDTNYMYGWFRRICVLRQSSNVDCKGEARLQGTGAKGNRLIRWLTIRHLVTSKREPRQPTRS